MGEGSEGQTSLSSRGSRAAPSLRTSREILQLWQLQTDRTTPSQGEQPEAPQCCQRAEGLRRVAGGHRLQLVWHVALRSRGARAGLLRASSRRRKDRWFYLEKKIKRKQKITTRRRLSGRK